MRVTEAAIFRALVAESDVWFWVQEQVGERVYRGALNLFEAACTAETARVNERYKPSMEPWDGSAAAHADLETEFEGREVLSC